MRIFQEFDRFDKGILSDKVEKLKIFDQVSEKYNI